MVEEICNKHFECRGTRIVPFLGRTDTVHYTIDRCEICNEILMEKDHQDARGSYKK